MFYNTLTQSDDGVSTLSRTSPKKEAEIVGDHSWDSNFQCKLKKNSSRKVMNYLRRRKLKTKPKDEFMPRYEELLNRFDGPPPSDNPFQSTFLQTQSYSKRLK